MLLRPALFLLPSLLLAADLSIPIQVQVMDLKGKPLSQSCAFFRRVSSGTPIPWAQTVQGKKGKLDILAKEEGLWVLMVRAHGCLDHPIMLDLKQGQRISMELRLPPRFYPEPQAPVELISQPSIMENNQFPKLQKNAKGWMEGVYEAKEPVRYRLQCMEWEGITVPAQKADRFEFDSGHKDFVGIVEPKNGKVKIQVKLDPKSTQTLDAQIKFLQEPEAETTYSAYKTWFTQIKSYLKAQLVHAWSSIGKRDAPAFRFDLNELLERFHGERMKAKGSKVEAFWMLSEASVRLDAGRLDAAVSKEVLESIPPQSPWWSCFPHIFPLAMEKAGLPSARSSALLEKAALHADPDIQFHALQIQHKAAAGDPAKSAELLKKIKDLAPRQPQAAEYVAKQKPAS